jgi:hypothetical protein
MANSDHVPIDGEYAAVSRTLLEAVPAFATSAEYGGLNSTERTLPGVVAAAFTRFFVARQERQVADETGVYSADDSLVDAYYAIEKLANSSDTEVVTLLQHEVFENIDAARAVWRAIESRLGGKSAEVFRKWRRAN